MNRKILLLAVLFPFCFTFKAQAQDYSAFKAPVIKKVEHMNRAGFHKKFSTIKWTGQGMYGETTMDQIPTAELRARLQAVYGAPTQTLKDLIHKKGFRPAECIEFEYWFVVNDSIPMMVLDVDGPFSKGLTYAAASRYIDLMPEIKRTFSKDLMKVTKLAPYKDYFYSPERGKWFLAEYADGKFSHKQIPQPKGMALHFDIK